MLGAFAVGWEIGTWLSEKFEIVRKAGIFMVEILVKAVEQAGLSEIPRLERHMNLLITLAQVLPMLGLFGTVLGLLQILAALQAGSPLVEIGTLSGGLWSALLTTAAGLATGIPAYAGYHFLVSRVESIALDMEQAAGEIIYFLTHSAPGARHEP